eukprot:3085242-Amphidinium_carterae.1
MVDSIPFVDGNRQEWLGFSLKTTPLSNLRLTVDAQQVAKRPFSGTAHARRAGWRHESQHSNVSRRPHLGQGAPWPRTLERRVEALKLPARDL